MEKDGSDKNTDGLESIKERRGAKSSMAFRRKTRPPFLDNLLPLFPWSGRGFFYPRGQEKRSLRETGPSLLFCGRRLDQGGEGGGVGGR